MTYTRETLIHLPHGLAYNVNAVSILALVLALLALCYIVGRIGFALLDSAKTVATVAMFGAVAMAVLS